MKSIKNESLNSDNWCVHFLYNGKHHRLGSELFISHM
ncbi:hypothetical protein LCGC14_3011810, partial [marine sediment metagenome]